ncbi:M48 family metalloprotease [Ramlibacter terrae]|uniref:M48 family metalloprotease n=1 Tax=Ramlibacter terrae TaxID=2732511 RepID=A0ABX6P0X5_9BURK|nr:M48 family metalloprotease [Ramlibacter terrae]
MRLSEQASAENSGRYRRSVALFAALGYGWVLGCFVLSLAAVAGWPRPARAAAFAGGTGVGITAPGLLWTSLRALWCRLEPPEGLRLARGDAQELFDAIERIRRKVKGPPLDGIYLQSDLNACIAQRPRWGLFGGARNDLGVGLPLLMAVDRQRLLAVLAHEYGHLRGEHGRFAAWIYRTRVSWTRLHRELDDDGVAARITRAFLDWYFPRFVARTFALARQDEYEADRIAGRLLGADVAGAALVEIAVKSQWLAAHFWRQHWAQAAHEPLPVGPFRGMRAQLALAPPADFAAAALRDALRQPSGLDDTHPGLRDRLESLEAAATLPRLVAPHRDRLARPEGGRVDRTRRSPMVRRERERTEAPPRLPAAPAGPGGRTGRARPQGRGGMDRAGRPAAPPRSRGRTCATTTSRRSRPRRPMHPRFAGWPRSRRRSPSKAGWRSSSACTGKARRIAGGRRAAWWRNWRQTPPTTPSCSRPGASERAPPRPPKRGPGRS